MIAGAKRLARNAVGAVAVPALAIATALIIGAIIVWRSGENPLVAYSSLLTGAFGSRSGVGESIVNMTLWSLRACQRSGLPLRPVQHRCRGTDIVG